MWPLVRGPAAVLLLCDGDGLHAFGAVLRLCGQIREKNYNPPTFVVPVTSETGKTHALPFARALGACVPDPETKGTAPRC